MSGTATHRDHPAAQNWSLASFVRCWLRTRHLGLLLQGLPAIALAVLLGGLMVSSERPPSSDTVDTYLARAAGEEGVAADGAVGQHAALEVAAVAVADVRAVALLARVANPVAADGDAVGDDSVAAQAQPEAAGEARAERRVEREARAYRHRTPALAAPPPRPGLRPEARLLVEAAGGVHRRAERGDLRLAAAEP